MRPLVKPALRRLWRDSTTLQLGLDPSRATVLSGVTPAVLGTLDLLDGTRRSPEVLRDAAEVGSGERAAAALVELLHDAGALDDAAGALLFGGFDERARMAPEHASLSLLHPAPGLAGELLLRRRRAHVRVIGAGRVGATLARLLASSGVGGLSVEDPEALRPADVMPGGASVREIGVPRQLAMAGLPEPARAEIDLAVFCPIGALEVPLAAASSLAAAGIPHLVARVRELRGVVGPLVLPGTSSCLSCLHLHRCDRDAGWPTLAAQLLGPERDEDPAAAALCATVAGIACLQVLEFLDAPADLWSIAGPRAGPSAGSRAGPDGPDRDLPATIGGTLELALPDWRIRRRSWPVHPLCGCVGDPAGSGRYHGGTLAMELDWRG